MAQNKLPGPVYAAAGASDLAAEQLKKLPDRVSGLSKWARSGLAEGRGRAELTELRSRFETNFRTWRGKASDLGAGLADRDVRADLHKIRETAQRRAGEFVDATGRNAAVAQVRAARLYGELVARGENLLGARTAPSSAELATKAENRIEPATKATADPVSKPVAKPAAKTAPKAAAKKTAPKAESAGPATKASKATAAKSTADKATATKPAGKSTKPAPKSDS